MALTYILPQIVNGLPAMQLEKTEVSRETEKWRCALIAYFIGEVQGFNAIKRYIGLHWAKIDEPDLFLHEEGYYVIKFQSIADRDEIYYASPYSINNKPIILKS